MATAQRAPAKAETIGPVDLVIKIAFGLVGITLTSWFVGMAIEVGGSMFLWRGQGIPHAQSVVQQDLEYIAAAPRSLLVPDTVGFSLELLGYIRWPYEKFGVIRWYQKARAPGAESAHSNLAPAFQGLGRITAKASVLLSEWAVISMLVAQDVVLRLSIAAYAMPAFVLACLMGVIDGLVRRDRRRWVGGRESSFVYHHSKRYTHWALTGGFSLYLAWPFPGFNPAYMVLVFTVLVAASLSTTVGAFKKYA
ncbi:TIGR03747 family integrating conjugative element membrane protein [Delftia sp. PS-11]|uniref:TIGR03747 family integrating conjugative element membrane protein n=1 Tax=Delftia sp. PS-11 TaxID=2767222 RepID=UPI0024540260|nr:TIGR03747 family integrating conjugative element membrane protein [Delftia sp. PS-11]KAJ8744130.1 TIGR03747 family integrating conjugative element membrane protein [Delftia sp. PS-11]